MLITDHFEAAELVKIVPAKKQARFYRLAIWPNLFGGFSLAREYGREREGGRLADREATRRAGRAYGQGLTRNRYSDGRFGWRHDAPP